MSMYSSLGCKFRLLIISIVALVTVLSVQVDPPIKFPNFKAAAVAYDPAWGDLESNILRMVMGVESVAKQNGGSSIWDPSGNKIAQLPVLRPKVLPSGVHGAAIATIVPAKSAPIRAALLARRRPEMYGVLALHRAPTDPTNGTLRPQLVSLTIEAGDLTKPAANAVWSAPKKDGLAILPMLFHYGPNLSAAEYRRLSEPKGGPSEKALGDLAKQGQGYAVGSYPERAGKVVYHTVALAAPSGEIVARYRATHLSPSSCGL